MRHFGLQSNSPGTDKIKDLPISRDFRIGKHRVATPTQYYIVIDDLTGSKDIEQPV